MKWKGMQFPKEVLWDESVTTDRYGKFIVYPLERGYGITLGNAIRRALLASMQGVAITAIRFDNVPHEFTTIPGVYEDIPEIILNFKTVRFKLDGEEFPRTIELAVEKKGEVTAGDIQTPPQLTILNPHQHIATLTRKIPFKVTLELGIGQGFVPAEENKRKSHTVRTIPIDSIFSPIRKVRYHVEPTRVGRRTDFDKLVLEVETEGSMTPKEAVSMAARILKEHLELFIQTPTVFVKAKEEKIDENVLRIRKLLALHVNELELSVRSSNCLKAAGIKTIADLVQKTEQEMLRYRNFGKKSLSELTKVLDKLGLTFGMDITKYLPTEEEED